jgi:predicted AlkP superfamily pyrophosphatase or phosphodiesterase
MKRVFSLMAFLLFLIGVEAQTKAPAFQRPKLVVGIVIDQMRWDYLYRFNALFSANGGFKRMMGEGFTSNNTLIPYAPTVTACGHTCVYTGSVRCIAVKIKQ